MYRSIMAVVLACTMMGMGAGSAAAASAYVTDELKFMVRTGQGTTNKIISVANSGDRVQVVQRDGDWAMVKLPNGKEGWMLARFLVDEAPGKVRMVKLEADYKALSRKYNSLRTEATALRAENRELAGTLKTSNTDLNQVRNDFKSLKADAAEYLTLKQDYARMKEQLKEQTGVLQELDELLLKRNIKMFALGAGVLLVGMLLGLSMRKKNSSRYL